MQWHDESPWTLDIGRAQSCAVGDNGRRRNGMTNRTGHWTLEDAKLRHWSVLNGRPQEFLRDILFRRCDDPHTNDVTHGHNGDDVLLLLSLLLPRGLQYGRL